MRWGAGTPQNIPGQDRAPALLAQRGRGRKKGRGDVLGLLHLWGLCFFPPHPFCWQGGFEGPGSSSWGERSPQRLDKAQAHAPILFLHHINKDDEGRQSLLFLFPKCSHGWLRVTLPFPLLPPQAQLSPAT